MNILSFGVPFTNEENCRLHFKTERDKIGVISNRCKVDTHYWLKSKWSYECKSCKSRESLRIGIIMED